MKEIIIKTQKEWDKITFIKEDESVVFDAGVNGEIVLNVRRLEAH